MPREYCVTDRCRKWKDLNSDRKCPACVKRIKKYQDGKSSDPIFPCGTCKNDCPEGSRSIMCDYCESWFHSQCVDLDDDAYDTLMKIKRLRWFCEACDSKVEEVIEKSNSLEKQTKALQSSLANVERRLDDVEAKVTGTVHREISSAINERADIERRKLNLVIYNLPEAQMNESNPSAWDTPDRIAKDTSTLSDILQTELKVDMEVNGKSCITNAIRLGRRLVDNKERRFPRPIKITLVDIQTKRQILTKCKELRESENPVAKILFVNPDLTEEQRKKDKALRNQMWKLREDEGKNVIIQRGQIVEASWNVRKTRTPKTSNVSNIKDTTVPKPKEKQPESNSSDNDKGKDNSQTEPSTSTQTSI